MSTPIEQERRSQGKQKLNNQLYQKLGEPLGESDSFSEHLFYENCLKSSSSPSIERHEILSEIAASQGVPVDKVENKFPVLQQKLNELKKIQKLVRRQKKILESSSSLRKSKKSIKKFLSLGTQRIRIMTEIVNDLWEYLPIPAKDAIGDFAYSLIFLRADAKVKEFYQKHQNFNKFSDFDKHFLCSLEAVSQFLKGVSEKAIGGGLNEQGLSEQNINETEYLFRSKKNVERLNNTIERSRLGLTKPITLDELYRELGASEEKEEKS